MKIENEKRCPKCGITKSTDEFYKVSGRKSGIYPYCKACVSDNGKNYYKANKEQRNLAMKAHYEANKEQYKDRSSRWEVLNKEKRKAYRDKNSASVKGYYKKYREANKEKCRSAIKLWEIANKERRRSSINTWAGIKRKTNPKYRLNCNTRTAIYQSLKGAKNRRHWEDLVGYTIDDLKLHLEKQFKTGMDWAGYGPVWSIDHIIPISAFNFETPEHEDFKRCWALKNLRPLWKKENLRKGSTLTKHFQPSLAI